MQTILAWKLDENTEPSKGKIDTICDNYRYSSDLKGKIPGFGRLKDDIFQIHDLILFLDWLTREMSIRATDLEKLGKERQDLSVSENVFHYDQLIECAKDGLYRDCLNLRGWIQDFEQSSGFMIPDKESKYLAKISSILVVISATDFF